jgi:hypothetical protein
MEQDRNARDKMLMFRNRDVVMNSRDNAYSLQLVALSLALHLFDDHEII